MKIILNYIPANPIHQPPQPHVSPKMPETGYQNVSWLVRKHILDIL